jgi:hypothetical protein
VAPFFVTAKVIQSVSFAGVSKSWAKAFRKAKKRPSAAAKQSIERVFGMPRYWPGPG